MVPLRIMALLWIFISVHLICAKNPDSSRDTRNSVIVSSSQLATSAGVETYTPEKEDSITVSLLTCWPGPEVYELCGHEAIRIRGEKVDSVWNYGVFSFDEPNFVYRFVKGETDYMLWGYPAQWFFDEYRARGSKVIEQDLDLSQEEARRLRTFLQNEALPQNRVYRYNYVKDNCATRIVERMDSAFGPVVYPDNVEYGTFRKVMRHYHRNYPWYQFGIDLALGSGLDYNLRGREEMFAPLEMMGRVDGATLPDGRSLVRESRVVVEGLPDATLPPTRWWLSPLFVMSLLLVCCIVISIIEFYKVMIIRWIYTVFYCVVGFTGLVIAYLVFVSTHEATSPNLMLLLFNPLQLLFAICVWWRRTLPIAQLMAVYNIVVVGGMFLMWPLQSQSANIAFFPIMLSSVVMALPYAIITIGKSYNYKDSVFPVDKKRKGSQSAKRHK